MSTVVAPPVRRIPVRNTLLVVLGIAAYLVLVYLANAQ